MEKELKNLLYQHKGTLKKAYGQNFLTDRMVVEDIADECIPVVRDAIREADREKAEAEALAKAEAEDAAQQAQLQEAQTRERITTIALIASGALVLGLILLRIFRKKKV